MQNLKYKYRLYPTTTQENSLKEFIGCNRYVWNYFLDKEIQEYNTNKKFKFYNTNSSELTQLKQTHEWLKPIPSTSLQQTLRYLDQALKASFKKNANSKKGFPKFKAKRNFEGSFSLTMVHSSSNYDYDNGLFKIPNLGWVKCKYHRELPSDFKSCQIKWECNQWFAVLTCSKPLESRTSTGLSIGIDLNSKEYVLSDGARIVVPKFLRESQTQIKRLQRQLARKTKGSKNRLKALLKLKKVQYRVAQKRLDFLHKLSRKLVDRFDIIAMEDLDVKAMQQWNGRMISDNGLSQLRQFITYKSELYGTKTVIISRWYPSSKTCSCCGHVYNIKHDPVYSCDHCGMELDRDYNAAINIHRAGMAQINAYGSP